MDKSPDLFILGGLVAMAAKDRVLSALNFLTGEGISYHPTGVDDGNIQALIEDYFNPESGSDSSGDDSDHTTDEGFTIIIHKNVAFTARLYTQMSIWQQIPSLITKLLKTPQVKRFYIVLNTKTILSILVASEFEANELHDGTEEGAYNTIKIKNHGVCILYVYRIGGVL